MAVETTPNPSSPNTDLAADITRLLIACHDRPGIVAAVAEFLAGSGANIVRSDQHSTDPEDGEFFMRMEFNLAIADNARAAFERRFRDTVAEPFGMRWRMHQASRRQRIAIFVSRYDHCLLDLLWRWRRNELDAELTMVCSNHEDLRTDVEASGLPYHHVPVDRDRKSEAEAKLVELVAGKADVLVLARYMQILSGQFLEDVGVPVINIHHSFLPAFAGAGAYERAKERGVKLIGATAHYVTEQLDAGPIIEQDVIRVSHRDDASAMIRLGADIERIVLARAVQRHCDDSILVSGSTTIVF